MEYGLIGEHLTHSFSKEIHSAIAEYKYELCEIEPENLEAFLRERKFRAINVTIPYKEKVIPCLDFVSDSAKAIGAVNTVVNRDGKLYGYNTDFLGMKALINYTGLELKGKKVLILGTGGTSKTASAVARELGAKTVLRVSRTKRGDGEVIDYGQAVSEHSDARILINTTPSGMYPTCEGSAIDTAKFPKLEGVIDAVYNPLRTDFVSDVLERGLLAQGGLYMLVAQAVFASEIFIDKKYGEEIINGVFASMLKEKENIVLTGMPGAGKTTVGKLLAKELGREFIDTDDKVKEKIGCEISEYIKKNGEAKFRDIETEAVKEASKLSGVVIATGGGAVLRAENVRALKRSGKVFFIDRPIDKITPTASRPLSCDRAALEARYRERYGIYTGTADITVDGSAEADEVAASIKKEFETI